MADFGKLNFSVAFNPTTAFPLDARYYFATLAEAKPSYSATEISGLADYISGEIQDTDTQYKLEVDGTNNRKFHLYSKAKGVAEWTL